MEKALIKAVCEYAKANHKEPKQDLAGYPQVEVAKCFETLMNENIIVNQTVRHTVTFTGDKYYCRLEISEHRLKEKYGITL